MTVNQSPPLTGLALFLHLVKKCVYAILEDEMCLKMREISPEKLGPVKSRKGSGATVMKKNQHDKLVRNRIPEILQAEGKKGRFEQVEGAAYRKRLDEKLMEEVQEFIASGALEELADIGEVMHAILEYEGISLEAFQKARQDKLVARGSFSLGYVLKEIQEDEA